MQVPILWFLVPQLEFKVEGDVSDVGVGWLTDQTHSCHQDVQPSWGLVTTTQIIEDLSHLSFGLGHANQNSPLVSTSNSQQTTQLISESWTTPSKDLWGFGTRTTVGSTLCTSSGPKEGFWVSSMNI